MTYAWLPYVINQESPMVISAPQWEKHRNDPQHDVPVTPYAAQFTREWLHDARAAPYSSPHLSGGGIRTPPNESVAAPMRLAPRVEIATITCILEVAVQDLEGDAGAKGVCASQ
jgi:hypothetical protein